MTTTKSISAHNSRINKIQFALAIAKAQLDAPKATQEMKLWAMNLIQEALVALSKLRKKATPGAFGKKSTRRPKQNFKLKTDRRKFVKGEQVMDSKGNEYIANAAGALVRMIRVEGEAVPTRSLKRNKKERRKLTTDEREFYRFAIA